MDWVSNHDRAPDVRFDGGDLDCGNGLLLLIRKHIDPLEAEQCLEVLSTDSSVEEDLPAWCRLTGNDLISRWRRDSVRSYLIRKGGTARSLPSSPVTPRAVASTPLAARPVQPITIAPLSVMGIGSWPRPAWLVRSLHEWLSGRLPEAEFQEYADDAVRLVVASQERADVDVVTDGEQRRDNYASFVGSRLENCQLIPVTDLLPYVDDPAHFAEELKSLDVPAESVRHPAVFGKIARKTPLAGHELERLKRFTNRPIKIALPGPYLLTRTMWLDCVSEKAYATREELASDVVRVLREEIESLLENGTALVQLDEPVLTEVVFTRPRTRRSFMCGALGEKRGMSEELAFAKDLLVRVLTGFPRERLAMHICRGNWSRDESIALSGPYTPLVPLLSELPVGTLFLEMATPRAGELEPLKDLPSACRIGIGVANQKLDSIEPVELIQSRAERAIQIFGAERVLLNPDCGFATFADNPVSSADVAERKLANIVHASRALREKYGITGN